MGLTLVRATLAGVLFGIVTSLVDHGSIVLGTAVPAGVLFGLAMGAVWAYYDRRDREDAPPEDNAPDA